MSGLSDLTLTGLQVCREISLLGSFSAAARSLGYSQPAVSRQVAAMERATGYPLFFRHAGGVEVTPAGAALVEHAGRILGDVDALARDLSHLGDRLAGRVRLGAFPTATATLVPATLARLSRDHPGLHVALTEASTPTLLRDLRSGRLDVAVIGVGAGLSDYDVDGLEHHQLFAGDLCVAVWSEHRLAAAPTASVGDLTGEQWIVGVGAPGDPQFGAWPTLTDPAIRYRMRGWPARLGLVAAGLGICVIPELAALSVPAGVVVVKVEDPNWLGRITLALNHTDADSAARAVVAGLGRAAADLRA